MLKTDHTFRLIVDFPELSSLVPQLKELLMSLKDDLMADIQAARTDLVDAVGRVNDDVKALQDQVAALEARLAEGSLDAAEQAEVRDAIASLRAEIKGLDPVQDGTVSPDVATEAGAGDGTQPA